MMVNSLDNSKKILYIMYMRGGRLHFIVILALIAVVSCGSGPKSGAKQDAADQPEEIFDPTRITRAQYDSTKEDVQHFIEQLNETIRKKDYNGWKKSLSPEYLAGISSSENLMLMSEQPAMKTRKIILKSAEDYFTYVVVPSRTNSRVDDIEFINRNRVKAFTVSTNKDGEELKLRLYDLEKINNSWKIIN